MKPGRKPADESRAGAIRTRLVWWRQIPEEQRPSLRELAEELGTTHQMLSFYLKGLEEWQRQEPLRKMKEISSRAGAENRLMSPAEQGQMAIYGRLALGAMVDSALDGMLEQIEADLRTGKLNRHQVQIVNRMVRRGIPRAEAIRKRLLAGRT